MNASLSKGQELVEFVWGTPDRLVRIHSYDFSQEGADAYCIATETSKYAREYWEGLVESGFRRTYSKVPTNVA